MNMEQVKKTLKALMVETWKLSETPEKMVDEGNVIDRYGVNSIDVLELLVKIEERFDIEIDDSDISSELVESIDNMAAYIYSHLQK